MKNLFLPLVLMAALCATTLGQAKIDLQAADTMRSLLERNVGQTVDLRLASGEKIGGKIEKVNEKLVHLSQLTGAEFYDAVVGIENVAAIALRTKTN